MNRTGRQVEVGEAAIVRLQLLPQSYRSAPICASPSAGQPLSVRQPPPNRSTDNGRARSRRPPRRDWSTMVRPSAHQPCQDHRHALALPHAVWAGPSDKRHPAAWQRTRQQMLTTAFSAPLDLPFGADRHRVRPETLPNAATAHGDAVDCCASKRRCLAALH